MTEAINGHCRQISKSDKHGKELKNGVKKNVHILTIIKGEKLLVF